MTEWTIALGLLVLILIPRMLEGRTPPVQESEAEPERVPQWRRHEAAYRAESRWRNVSRRGY
jgi:hypothetical protein